MHPETARLWERLAPELATYFALHLPDRGDAEDFVADTFVMFIEHAEVGSPEHLLRVVAKRLLINEYRRKGIRKVDLDTRKWPGVEDRQAIPLREQIDGGDSLLPNEPFASMEDQLFASDFDGALRDLDQPERDAFLLTELRGLPSREAAALLGISHTTVVSRRELATATVRKEIAA